MKIELNNNIAYLFKIIQIVLFLIIAMNICVRSQGTSADVGSFFLGAMWASLSIGISDYIDKKKNG
jgi:hypothetical protein